MKSKYWIMGLMAIMVIALSPTASATLQLTLQSGASNILVLDNGIGDANGAIGQVTFIGAVGNWNLNVTTGTIGANPVLDLNSVDTLSGAGTGANALTLTWSATGITSPSNGSFVSHVGGTLGTGHSLTYIGSVNGAPIGNALSFSNPPSAFSGSTAGGVFLANTPYDLTQVVTLSGTSNGTTSFDAAIDTVPEPASVALLGGILMITFGTLRRRTRRG